MEAGPVMHRIVRKRLLHSPRGSRGFSLLELLIVVSLFMVVAGMTFMAVQPALKDARANQAFNLVMMQMRIARQRAIAERKQYIVCFGAGSAPTGALTPMATPTAQSVQMFRWDAGTALSAAVQINVAVLPSDMQFQAVSGVPNSPTTRARRIRQRNRRNRLRPRRRHGGQESDHVLARWFGTRHRRKLE